MNFIFISPGFPKSYSKFCIALKNNGINVLGIGDTPYNELEWELKCALTEYYYLPSMEDYSLMFKAVAYFSYKYGKIDFLESNNEYWLMQDSKLRLDFNITGSKPNDVLSFTRKSDMKDYYKLAGVPVARYKFITTINSDLEFINMVGYPVIVKPNIGVGATATYKIKNEHEYIKFYNECNHINYIIEEYIYGDIISFDGICNSNSEVVFCDNEVFPPSIMDIVNDRLEFSYYVNKACPAKLKDIGSRVLKAFNIKSRYFHLEFFRLREDKDGLGKVGDIVALETNMRPPGGYTPDMINFSQGVDSYRIYADIIAYDEIKNVSLNNEKHYCLYFGRRNHLNYKYSYDDILKMYPNILMHDIIPEVLAQAMGNEFYIINFNTLEEMEKFKEIVRKKAD